MNSKTKHSLLVNFFLASVKNHPDAIALDVNNKTYSYSVLYSDSKKISENGITGSNPFVAILAYRSTVAYSGILATLLAGKGYVPLNPKFPIQRSLTMLAISKASTMIVGKECFDYFKEIIASVTTPFVFIFPGQKSSLELVEQYSQHTFIFLEKEHTHTVSPVVFSEYNSETIAYLLFTSGSTGTPKAVPVSNKNAVEYVDYVLKNYNLTDKDICSQSFDLTFDPSVHDMFVSWAAGACLCVVPESDLIAPANFIKNKKITVWYSVPSIGKLLSQLRMLKPNSFPSLRYSFFSAEALTLKMVQEWQLAAPDSLIVNFYGPTEATINITYYNWDRLLSEQRCINGNVPIGWIFDTQNFCIINENGIASKSGTGELYISGSQITKGYMNNPEKTAFHYVTIPGQGELVWYRTGDLVKADNDGCIHFMGRVDEQIKIRGYRVELQEIDFVIKTITNTEQVITVPMKNTDNSVKKLVSFICKNDTAPAKNTILDYCRERLPVYMIPDDIYFIDTMPLNANGKVDKKKLIENII